MSKISKELIENYRKIVLPFVSNRLYKTNFEGQGETDKTEFEHDFNEILDLAISVLNPTNALTVDLKDIYQEGHYDGHLEGYTKAINEKRPQGEWQDASEKNIFGEDVKCFECSNCHRTKVMNILIYEKLPFCPNCGTDMRKGGAE